MGLQEMVFDSIVVSLLFSWIDYETLIKMANEVNI
jgi:hypothetical protein